MRSQRLALAALALVVLSVPVAAQARIAEVYAGTWGPAGLGQGRVFQYVDGTTWTEISPPLGLGDAVWDLEFEPTEGILWASTHLGPQSDRDPLIHHGAGGRVLRWDGATWTDVSPPGGFGTAATSVTAVAGEIYATVDDVGIVHWLGGTSWEVIDNFNLAGQSIASDIQDGPALYVAQDNHDEFWRYVPGGAPCGTPPPRTPLNGKCDPEFPALGAACSADCHGGSCVHAFTIFDDGTGPSVFGGAFTGRIYKWDAGERLFVRLDDVPYSLVPPFDFTAVQGLAGFQGRLYAGISDGTLWSSSDATAATWQQDFDFSLDEPFSDLFAVPEDDLLWMGHGGVPFRWARRDGTPSVRTFDGTSIVDRSGVGELVPGRPSQGVLVLAAAVPFATCDAGPDQVVECAGTSTEVDLDGSGTVVAKGFPVSYTWTGPFVEGTANGETATVHFAGPGSYDVTLTVTVGRLTVTCTTLVQVVDSTPPVLTGGRACLWPPNHRYRCFSAAELTGDGTGVIVDACEGTLVAGIVGVTSSQPEDELGQGDGHTQDDALFDEDTVCVRSERQGDDETGAGRDYFVTLAVTDAAGAVTTATGVLHVPHDQRTERRCDTYAGGVGLLPNADLPLDADYGEGTYPPPTR